MKLQDQIQLSIPIPCNEDWNKMTTEEQGRHCAVCNKTVIDFTSMSDEEIIQYFSEPKGKTCGRILSDKLVVKSSRLSRKIKLFLYSLASVFLLGGSIQMQAQTAAINDSSIQIDTCSIHGKVVDEKGLPLDYASLYIMQAGLIKGAVKTDRYGCYKIDSLQKGKYDLKITYIGYKESVICGIPLSREKSIELNVSMEMITLKDKGNRQAIVKLILACPRIMNPSSPNEKKVTREQIMNSPF